MLQVCSIISLQVICQKRFLQKSFFAENLQNIREIYMLQNCNLYHLIGNFTPVNLIYVTNLYYEYFFDKPNYKICQVPYFGHLSQPFFDIITKSFRTNIWKSALSNRIGFVPYFQEGGKLIRTKNHMLFDSALFQIFEVMSKKWQGKLSKFPEKYYTFMQKKNISEQNTAIYNLFHWSS